MMNDSYFAVSYVYILYILYKFISEVVFQRYVTQCHGCI